VKEVTKRKGECDMFLNRIEKVIERSKEYVLAGMRYCDALEKAEKEVLLEEFRRAQEDVKMVSKIAGRR
jgi:hypothetical protein